MCLNGDAGRLWGEYSRCEGESSYDLSEGRCLLGGEHGRLGGDNNGRFGENLFDGDVRCLNDKSCLFIGEAAGFLIDPASFQRFLSKFLFLFQELES